MSTIDQCTKQICKNINSGNVRIAHSQNRNKNNKKKNKHKRKKTTTKIVREEQEGDELRGTENNNKLLGIHTLCRPKMFMQ